MPSLADAPRAARVDCYALDRSGVRVARGAAFWRAAQRFGGGRAAARRDVRARRLMRGALCGENVLYGGPSRQGVYDCMPRRARPRGRRPGKSGNVTVNV